MPTDFQKAKRRVKLANGNWSKPISYLTSSESVEMTDGTDLQTKIDNHYNDTTKHITATERTDWNDANSKKHEHSNKSVLDDTTASYTAAEKQKLAGIASGAEVNVQSDWDQTTTTADDFIKNKPQNLVSDASYVHTDNNYTTTEKDKLSGIQAGANKTVVDTALSDASTNPVQNKAISKELAGAKTATGSLITLTDASNTNLIECVAEVEAQQSGSRDPSPSNIRPITGQTEVVIEDVGKNLWDETYPDISNSIYYKSIFVGDGQFTLSTTTPKDSNNNTNLFLLAGEVTSGGSSAVNGVSVNNPKTVTSVNGYVTIGYRLQYGVNPINYNTQLEKGNTATEYEPYKGKTYTIQLGNTIYGGELDVITGKLTVTHGEVDLGSLNWIYNSEYQNFYSADETLGEKRAEGITMISSAYKGVPNVQGAAYVTEDGTICGYSNTAYHRFYVKDTRYTNATTFKSAVTGQTLVYELATPYTIQLTPQQIKLIKGTNNISCNTGDLSIKYQPDNALGDLLAEAEIGYDKQIEYIKTSLIPSRERNDITNRLQMLPQAVAEQNLEKYGYKIGDYFTGPVANYTYHLADPNTFKGTLTPYCLTQNHLGIVVDTHTTSQWYSGDASSVGYNGSTLHTYLKGTVMDNIKADMIYFFGGTTGLEHLLPHSKLLTTALANWGWQANQYISALSEIQAIGSTVWSANGYQTGEAAKKLEIFNKYKWTEIFENRYPWLRNMQTASHACGLSNGGSAYYPGVTDASYVVGLINFY